MHSAEFHGRLDIKTLGGAGFASQRTAGEERVWDLTSYEGIELDVKTANDKQYTFILKDELLPCDPDTGREQSTVSYEYDFRVPSSLGKHEQATSIFIAWTDFKATYRGREKKDATPLKIRSIRRMSMMTRRYGGASYIFLSSN